jgi:hypothetical protein
MSSSNSTTITLTGIQNWEEWQEYLASTVEDTLWEAIRPDDRQGQILQKPRMPESTDYSPDGQLTATQNNNYKVALEAWNHKNKEYRSQNAQVIKAREKIRTTVDARLGRTLHRSQSLTQWMDNLKAMISVEQPREQEDLAQEYQRILKSFDTSTKDQFLAWVWKWEDFLMKAANKGLTEAITARWLFGVASLITKVNPSFGRECLEAAGAFVEKETSQKTLLQQKQGQLEQQLLRSDGREYKEDVLQFLNLLKQQPQQDFTLGRNKWSIPKVGEIMRSWGKAALPDKPAEKGRIQRGAAFQTASQGTTQEDKKRKRESSEDDKQQKCEACGYKGHPLASCWTAIPELAPEWSKPPIRRLKIVKENLAKDPALQLRVRKLREEATQPPTEVQFDN